MLLLSRFHHLLAIQNEVKKSGTGAEKTNNIDMITIFIVSFFLSRRLMREAKNTRLRENKKHKKRVHSQH